VSRRIERLPAAAAEPLAQLHAACFPEDPWDAPALERILSLAGCFGLVAWDDENPVGFVLARDLAGEIEVLSLGVSPECRRSGLGRWLIEATFAEAVRCGGGSVVLEVAVDNDAARALYAQAGFVAVGRRPRYYASTAYPKDALILRRILANIEDSL